jgi:protein-S-isoprenylcysteine O-methyltransferase Ste14
MTLYRFDAETSPNCAARWAGITYGVVAFALTFAFFTHFVIFLGNLPQPSDPWVTPSIDIGGTVHPALAALIDIGLVALFGLQHSLMARPGYKEQWTRIVPPGLERSTYVVAASAAGFIMLVFWQPIPFVIWEADGMFAAIFWTMFAAGWLLLLASAISFDIFELLGIRQSFAWAQGNPPPALTLKTGGPYRMFRHPMYVGVLLGLWMTPLMTAGHALIAAGFTVYILIARRYEERDLRHRFRSRYS